VQLPAFSPLFSKNQKSARDLVANLFILFFWRGREREKEIAEKRSNRIKTVQDIVRA
jgi:hypothetical protein